MPTQSDTALNATPKERLWNVNYWRAMIGNTMMVFSFYLLTPLLPIYLDAQFGADHDTIGLVLSGYVIAALLVRPLSGFFVDAFDRKKVLLICFFLFFILFTGYIGAGTLLMFAIVRTLHGLPYGATTVANSTVAIDVLPSSRRNEGIGLYGLSSNVGLAVAPSVGIYIYHLTGNFAVLFWIALAISFVGLLVVSTIKIKVRPPVADKKKLSLDHFFLGRAWLLAANILLFGLCWGVMSNYVAIYSQKVLGITDGTGLFFALLSAGLITSRLYGAKSLREGRITQNAIQGALLGVAGYTLFAISANEYTYYLSAFLVGLGNGKLYPAFLNMFICMARHDQRGTANSSILTSWDVGMGLGILLGGFAVEYIGFSAAFWITAASQILGTAILVAVTRQFSLKRKLHD